MYANLSNEVNPVKVFGLQLYNLSLNSSSLTFIPSTATPVLNGSNSAVLSLFTSKYITPESFSITSGGLYVFINLYAYPYYAVGLFLMYPNGSSAATPTTIITDAPVPTGNVGNGVITLELFILLHVISISQPARSHSVRLPVCPSLLSCWQRGLPLVCCDLT